MRGKGKGLRALVYTNKRFLLALPPARSSRTENLIILDCLHLTVCQNYYIYLSKDNNNNNNNNINNNFKKKANYVQ